MKRLIRCILLGMIAFGMGSPNAAAYQIPAYEKKVNWNIAVFLIDYQDIPAEHREKWPTVEEWERLIFHDKLQEFFTTISNGQFIITGDVFDYTTSTATFWDSSGVLLDSQEVLDTVDFQVSGFQPNHYDLIVILSGHDAALGGSETAEFNVTVNGTADNRLSVISYFQIGYPYRSTSYSFENTLIGKKDYLIPLDDGTSEEGDVLYEMTKTISTLCHELIHAMGIGGHANSRTNGDRFDYEPEVPNNGDFLAYEYGNSYDIMGNEQFSISLNGSFRDIAGLLPQDDIETFSEPGSFTTRLHPINSTQSPRYLEVLLPFEAAPGSFKNRGYGLEVRNINWMDTMLNHPQLDGNLEGVFVIKNHGISNQLLDMSPSPNINMNWGEPYYDIRDVVLKPGMVYENDEVKLYGVVDHGDGSFSVSVDIKNDKAATPAPVLLSATVLSPSRQIRLDWENHHLGSGNTAMIQIFINSFGFDGWQPLDTVANNATSYTTPWSMDPGDIKEFRLYVLEDTDNLRSLDSNVVATGCNLVIDHLIEKNISCPGADDGTVEILVSGGTAPYQYGISGQTGEASNIVGNLTPGSHTVFVHDALRCQTSAETAVIIEPQKIEVAVESSPGSIEVLANFGTGLYEYSLDSTTWGTDPHLALVAGQETVYVRDQRGCLVSFDLGIFADGFENGDTSAWSSGGP